MAVRLLEIRDRHYAWMAGEKPAPWRMRFEGLRLAPGDIIDADIFDMLRTLTHTLRKARCRSSWMIVADGEVVGIASYKAVPDGDGAVEFGYGIAESRRGRGIGTAAIAEMVKKARQDPAVRCLIAVTTTNNQASQRVLLHNGFERTGTQIDPDEDLVVIWQCDARPSPSWFLRPFDFALRLRQARTA